MIPIYLYDTDIQIYDTDITLKNRYHTDISVPGIGNGMGGLGDIGIGLNITRYR